MTARTNRPESLSACSGLSSKAPRCGSSRSIGIDGICLRSSIIVTLTSSLETLVTDASFAILMSGHARGACSTSKTGYVLSMPLIYTTLPRSRTWSRGCDMAGFSASLHACRMRRTRETRR